MKAIYVNSSGIDYAAAIVGGYKKIETRAKNVLYRLEGERVAVIRTGRGAARVIGYVTVIGKQYAEKDLFDRMFNSHLVPPGSRYDCKPGAGKWCYYLTRPETCTPYPVPAGAVRHGRSWCEWSDVTDAMRDYVSDAWTEENWYNTPRKLSLDNAADNLEEWRREYDDVPDGMTPAILMELWNELCD